MKNRHYYNKQKFEIITPQNANAIQVLRAVRKDKSEKETIWFDFLNDYIYNEQYSVINNRDNLALILKLIHSKQTLKMIISYLYNEQYIPNKDSIPTTNMPDDLYYLLKKKQDYIDKYFFYEYVYKDTIVVFNKKENVEYFKDKYETVIGLCGEYTYIYTKDVSKLFELLNTVEPDTWVIRDNYIYNWKRKTKINFLDNKNIQLIQKGELNGTTIR